MKELIWLNGDVMLLSQARIGVEDRGFQFADGVYEVIRAYDGRLFALRPHIDRLERSGEGIKLELPIAKQQLCEEIEKLSDQSGLRDGIVYVQLTRGCCARNHLFPSDAKPTLLFYARQLPPVPAPGSGQGITLHSVRDVRWRLCWIKSIALLANILAKNEAAAAGADEAVFVDSGFVSECSTSNLYAVIGGEIVTHPVGEKVLPGITRKYLLDCARELRIPVQERAVLEREALSATEVFISSTTREVNWVSRWNNRTVGRGTCGEITLRLHRAFQERVRRELAHVGNAATDVPVDSPSLYARGSS